MGPSPGPLGLVITRCMLDGGTARAHGISRDEVPDTHIIKKEKKKLSKIILALKETKNSCGAKRWRVIAWLN